MYMYDHFLLNISQLVMMNLKVSLQYLKLIRLVLCAPIFIFLTAACLAPNATSASPRGVETGPPATPLTPAHFTEVSV